MGKRELVALFSVSSWCLVIAVWLFLEVPRVCLQFVIVVFPDHTQLLLVHARLRNNCSNLNNDLFINHLRKRPFSSLQCYSVLSTIAQVLRKMSLKILVS